MGIKEFFKKIKYIWLDKKNEKIWQEEISLQVQDPDSDFNRLNLKLSTDQRSISHILELPENYQIATSDIIKYQKLMELIMPVNRFLLKIGWAEYFPFHPQFFHFDGTIDDVSGERVSGDTSCTYIAIWTFSPLLENDKTFWRAFYACIGAVAALIGGGIAAAIMLL